MIPLAAFFLIVNEPVVVGFARTYLATFAIFVRLIGLVVLLSHREDMGVFIGIFFPGVKMAQNACLWWDWRCTWRSDEDVTVFKSWMQAYCREWSFQLEKGNETGVLHYQGRFALKEKCRKAAGWVVLSARRGD